MFALTANCFRMDGENEPDVIGSFCGESAPINGELTFLVARVGRGRLSVTVKYSNSAMLL